MQHDGDDGSSLAGRKCSETKSSRAVSENSLISCGLTACNRVMHGWHSGQRTRRAECLSVYRYR